MTHEDSPQILNSWKEIASYMDRGIRTVQRWESDLDLPVHRPRGHARSAVIAITAELDEWVKQTPIMRREMAAVEEPWEPQSHSKSEMIAAFKEQQEKWNALVSEFEQARSCMRESRADLRTQMSELSETMARLRVTRKNAFHEVIVELVEDGPDHLMTAP